MGANCAFVLKHKSATSTGGQYSYFILNNECTRILAASLR